ncbi:MAG: hypothetical protein ACJA00_004172 [Myxococcota bacterium]
MFRLQVDNDYEANITLGFVHEQGDLDLFVCDGNTQVTRSDSQDNDESLPFAPDGCTYSVFVRGYQGSTNDYLTVVDLDCEGDVDTDPDTEPDTNPSGGIDDGFEENDTRQTAGVPMSDGVVRSGQVCAYDPDWHAVSTTACRTVTVNMDSNYSATTDLDMDLRRPNFTAFGAAGTSANDNESITAVTQTDTFYGEIWGYQSSEAPYTLDVIEDCSAVCSPDSYEGANRNNSVRLATPLDMAPAPLEANICNTLDLYRITPDDDCTLGLDLSFNHTESSDLSLVLRTSNGSFLG